MATTSWTERLSLGLPQPFGPLKAPATDTSASLKAPIEGVPIVEEMECGVCLGLLCEPITTPCGHTICRMCLVRSLQRQPKCPICRAVCHISAEGHAETHALSRLARKLYPDLYVQRLEEVRQEREELKLLLPIFFYNLPIFPSETLRLHLFEPRYKLMMRRIVDTTRRFAYVPKYTSYSPAVGDVACIAELKEVSFYRDGRSELEAKIVGRFNITDHYMEEQTGGLHYCRVAELKDDAIAEQHTSEVEALCKQAWPIANFLFMDRRDIRPVVVDRYGELPSTRSPEVLSLWLAAVLPLERDEKHRLLASKDTRERLQVAFRSLSTLQQSVVSA